MKRIFFRRPLYILDYDRDMGMVVHPWIVLFGKLPVQYGTSRYLDDAEAKKKGYRIEQTVLQYRYILKIDLWLAILEFEWHSKIQATNGTRVKDGLNH